MTFAERNHALEETKYILILPQLIPVQPPRFIVLVIGIVVAELRIQEFIASSEHRDAVRQHQQTAEILYLLPAEREHLRWRRFVPFVATVPAVVVVSAITVVATVRPVMFVVIGHEIEEGKAVVRSYVVDSLVGVVGVGSTVRE